MFTTTCLSVTGLQIAEKSVLQLCKVTVITTAIQLQYMSFVRGCFVLPQFFLFIICIYLLHVNELSVISPKLYI